MASPSEYDEQPEEWDDIDTLVAAIENYKYHRAEYEQHEGAGQYLYWDSKVIDRYRKNLVDAATWVRRAIRAVTTGVADVPLIPLTEEEKE